MFTRRFVLKALAGAAVIPYVTLGIHPVFVNARLPAFRHAGQALALSDKATEFLWGFAEAEGKLNEIIYAEQPESLIQANLTRYARELQQVLTDNDAAARFIIHDIATDGPVSKIIALREE